ncbi:MAG TPA: SprT-like domain-containing protein [Gemmataceae bacterium]|nr:SprT-like domain-containing protein [Gemmataceae bacterium]
MSFSSCGPLVTEAPIARTAEIRAQANEMLAIYDLNDWTFAFNRRKTAMGLCLYGPKRIELSLHFAQRNGPVAVRDTLLHEIAHALVGPGHGHDKVWKQKCAEIGGKPERLSFDVEMPAGRWQARCGCCGMLHSKHRRPKHPVGWYCTHCGKERGRLTWGLARQLPTIGEQALARITA